MRLRRLLLHPIRSWKQMRRDAFLAGLVRGLWSDYGEIRVDKRYGDEDVTEALMRVALARAVARTMDRAAAEAFRAAR